MDAHSSPEYNSPKCSATIGRFDAEYSRWRVVVEAWPKAEHFEGRLVFQQDDRSGSTAARVTAPMLSGRTPEEVVSAAYEMPEKRVRAVLRSLL